MGYCTFLGGNLMARSSKKRDLVAHSNAEAKFQGLAQSICEAL